MMASGEAIHDMHTVLRALSHMRIVLAGEDQARAARELAPTVAYSPLRTLVEHAEQAAERVTAYLGGGR